MKGFIIGTVAAFALVTLTYLGLQFGSVTTAERYSVPTVQFGADLSVESVPE